MKIPAVAHALSSKRLEAAACVLASLFALVVAPCSGRAQISEVNMLPPQYSWGAPPEQAPVVEGRVDVGGARLWYRDTGGSGEPVVFVHPNSGSALFWKYQQPVLVEAGYRVIAYSRRGHYGSDAGDEESPGTGVDDLVRVLEHLEVGRLHLVGIAAGADIVPDFAVSYPDRLLTLTIGNTIGKPGDPAWSASDETLLPVEFRALPTWLKELSPAYRAGNPQGASEWRELAEISRVRVVPIRSKNEVTPESIAGIESPTLLFTGDSDLYMPPSRLRAYARYWRNPEVAIFREAGHAPYWEQPEAFNRLLIDFLDRHAASGAGQGELGGDQSVTDIDESGAERSALAVSVASATEPGVAAFGQRDIGIRLLPAQTEWQPVPPQAPVTEGTVDVDGVRLWYRDTGGDGVPVVLLHPYTGSALIWGYQQPELVRAGYRVIAYSRRGHYGSDAGPEDDPGTSADDLHALVNHLQLDAFHLVGSAAGGFIVPDYAISYPDRLLSITIATSTGGAQDAQYAQVFATIRTPEIVALPHWTKELGPSYRAANPEGTRAWIDLEHSSAHTILRPPAKNALQWDEYEAIDLPVLLIGADADIYMPPAMLRELAARLSNVEVVMLSESGHSGYWEQPEAFNQALIGFLQRQDGAN